MLFLCSARAGVSSRSGGITLRHFIYSAKVSPDHFPDVSNFDANNNHRLPNKSSRQPLPLIIRVFLFCALQNINLVSASRCLLLSESHLRSFASYALWERKTTFSRSLRAAKKKRNDLGMTNRAHYFSSPRLRYNTASAPGAHFAAQSGSILDVENFFFFQFVFFTNSVYTFQDLKT